MKRLLLAARSSDNEKVLNVLREAGIVHFDPVDPTSVTLPQGLSVEIDSCNKAISILEQIKDPQATLASPGTPSRIIEEILEHAKAIPELKSEISKLNREIEDVKIWGDLGLEEIKILKENGVKFLFVKGDEEAISAIEDATVHVVENISGNQFAAVASNSEIELPEGVTVIDQPEKEVSTLLNEIDALNRKIKTHEEALEAFALRIDDLRDFSNKLLNKKRFSEIETGALLDESIKVWKGWCPVDSIDALNKAIEEASLHVGIQLEDPEEGDTPPTKLENKAWVNSIRPMYDFMGLTPSYNEPDTSGIFLFMLAVFASFLLADAGYGLIVFIAALVLYKPLVNKGADKNALKLAMFLFGGISIYGILTNTWFGEHFVVTDANKFNPDTEEGMKFLQGICFLMGACHLTLAHILKIRRKAVTIKTVADVAWIIFIWAMYGVICSLILGQEFVLPGSWVGNMFKVSIALILIFTEPSANPFKMLFAGLGAIAGNAANCFSDVVSYIRLWAVGLAGGKVAQAFNNIGGMLPSVILQIPILVVGHAINIILGVIAILAHGVRLNLLEFSNHLELDWAGRRYDPFKEIK
jgi:V/A-type H+-transporting ATPase subunit I